MNHIEWVQPNESVVEMYRTAIGDHLARLNELDSDQRGLGRLAEALPFQGS